LDGRNANHDNEGSRTWGAAAALDKRKLVLVYPELNLTLALGLNHSVRLNSCLALQCVVSKDALQMRADTAHRHVKRGHRFSSSQRNLTLVKARLPLPDAYSRSNANPSTDLLRDQTLYVSSRVPTRRGMVNRFRQQNN